MARDAGSDYPVRWWVPGDWNAFFGLFTNVILNVIVLTGLTLGVVKLPSDVVFGRIVPALGIALPLGNLYYAYLAYQLARRERRDTVTAMPYGPSVPHMFIVVFLIMLPIALRTGNPIAAWQAGLAWCFVIGIIILLGAFIGPTIRKHTPRAAMLGTLAGISITFISMRPAFQSWEVPWIAFISLGIIMVSWMAGGPSSRQRAGRPPRCDHRHRDRVDHDASRLERGHEADRGGRSGGSGRAQTSHTFRRRSRGPRGHRAAPHHRDPSRRLQLYRGHEQRRERGGRR
jgi:hypothetical protein